MSRSFVEYERETEMCLVSRDGQSVLGVSKWDFYFALIG